MARYRKKPIEIEAIQYNGFLDNGQECEIFIGNAFESHIPSKNQIIIRTLEGEMTASLGDYIIRGIQGEVYPCKPDIFEESYVKVY